MLWTAGRIEPLKRGAAEAQGKIKDLVINGSSPTGDGWGQWLDGVSPGAEPGIYGTSACMQILVASGYLASNEVIDKPSRNLDAVFAEENNQFRRDGDVDVVYKVSYLAEAFHLEKCEIKSASPPMDELSDRALEGGGWGEYFCSRDDHDPHPRVIPTSAALLALRRYEAFIFTKKCEESLCWLGRHIIENGRLFPNEFTLASLVLIEYSLLKLPKSEQGKTAVETCERLLVDWAISRKREEIGTAEAYCYSVRWKGRRNNRYLFFLPDCLATLALLKLGCPKKTRSYILRVSDYFAKEILLRGGLRPVATRRISSVDHLWIYRLLRELRSTDTKQLSMWPRWLSFTLVFWAPLFLALGCFGLYWVYESAEPIVRVSGLVLGTISLGLLVGLLVRFLWPLGR